MATTPGIFFAATAWLNVESRLLKSAMVSLLADGGAVAGRPECGRPRRYRRGRPRSSAQAGAGTGSAGAAAAAAPAAPSAPAATAAATARPVRGVGRRRGGLGARGLVARRRLVVRGAHAPSRRARARRPPSGRRRPRVGAAPPASASVMRPVWLTTSWRMRRSRVISRGEPGGRLKPRSLSARASVSMSTAPLGAWSASSRTTSTSSSWGAVCASGSAGARAGSAARGAAGSGRCCAPASARARPDRSGSGRRGRPGADRVRRAGRRGPRGAPAPRARAPPRRRRPGR